MVPRIFVISLALVAGCTAATSTPVPEAASPPVPAAVTLHPGDVLEITVWREEDLSGEFPVDETGTATLPLLGAVEVTGVPLAELRDSLIAAYRTRLVNPSITIVPRRRVYVLGEVNAPGLYAVDPTVRLAGAIALAEGATADGDLSRVRLIRDGAVLRERLGAGERLDAIDIRSGDQIYVEEKSVLRRNRGVFLSSVLSVVASVVATYLIVRITN